MDSLVKNSYYYFRVFAENAIGQSQPLESEQAIAAKPAYSNSFFFFFLFFYIQSNFLNMNNSGGSKSVQVGEGSSWRKK
jgi:hypothetical protein